MFMTPPPDGRPLRTGARRDESGRWPAGNVLGDSADREAAAGLIHTPVRLRRHEHATTQATMHANLPLPRGLLRLSRCSIEARFFPSGQWLALPSAPGTTAPTQRADGH